MILVVDIGNTHTVFGLVVNSEIKIHWRITSSLARTEDEIGILLKDYFQHSNYNFSDVTGVCISSVVPDLSQAYVWMSQKYLGIDAMIINSDLDLGMNVKYRDPKTVGADRLCNAVAGIKNYGKPLIILDFGTATTFDCIDQSGDYIGGVIAPGIETSIGALHRRAAKLPLIELKIPEFNIGQTTEESIQVGILKGTIHSVEGIIKDIRSELGQSAKVIATGGLAKVIAKKTDIINEVVPFLSLEGIALIYNRNKI
ncbi:MAG: type III pantothenate kinase [Calditrichaeota bacterium]|nr:MAG: type III pantothenate kinase [Calditrichota bacterium]MBL1204492.1 type III pantothenate kinase [Calditrichota bacterium]NOG44321.1 type III pantothenate kinase [Calditrichota bacterium]